jgi:predicted  nucleic acid-binding Zn-ribbon protein
LAMCVKCAKRNCSGNHMMLPTKFTAEICKPQSM